MDYTNEEQVDTVCVCVACVCVCLCVCCVGGELGAMVCVTVQQQVDTCCKESGVRVDSQWNVSDLYLCACMNTRS